MRLRFLHNQINLKSAVLYRAAPFFQKYLQNLKLSAFGIRIYP